MGKKNDYLARQEKNKRTLQDATRQTFVQYMTDTLDRKSTRLNSSHETIN